jgi:hypothetical protein
MRLAAELTDFHTLTFSPFFTPLRAQYMKTRIYISNVILIKTKKMVLASKMMDCVYKR